MYLQSKILKKVLFSVNLKILNASAQISNNANCCKLSRKVSSSTFD